MANDTLDLYKSWLHEKKRGLSFGHSVYAENCQQEIDRLETEHPDWVGQECTCQECVDNKFNG